MPASMAAPMAAPTMMPTKPALLPGVASGAATGGMVVPVPSGLSRVSPLEAGGATLTARDVRSGSPGQTSVVQLGTQARRAASLELLWP